MPIAETAFGKSTNLCVCVSKMSTHLLERQLQTEGRNSEIKIFHLLDHFLTSQKGQGWPKCKSGAVCRSPKKIQRPKHLGRFPLLFAGHYHGVGSEVEQTGHTPVPIWEAGTAGNDLTQSTKHKFQKLYVFTNMQTMHCL